MTFDQWLAHAKELGYVPYGTAYKLLARKAWNAAIDASVSEVAGFVGSEPIMGRVQALKTEQ